MSPTKGWSIPKDLTRLQRLYLHEIPITDAGLVNLEKLNRLEVLALQSTRVTDKAVRVHQDPPRPARAQLDQGQYHRRGFAPTQALEGSRYPGPGTDQGDRKGPRSPAPWRSFAS